MKAKTSKPGNVTMQQAVHEAEKPDNVGFVSMTAALEGWFDKPLEELPETLREWIEREGKLSAMFWDILTEERRRQVVGQRDYKYDPATRDVYLAHELIGWHDGIQSMAARTWFDMVDVVPKEAAMVLCRLNPLQRDDPESIYVDGDKSSPERYRQLLRVFEDVARTTPKHRTLMEWRAIAQRRGLQCHTWIDEYAAALELTGGQAETGGSVISIGISRNEVMGKFAVKTDSDENIKFWDDKLGRPPQWLKSALVQRGKPGKSSRWNPLMIAHCLLNEKRMTLRQLNTAMHAGFPELYETWKGETEDVK